MKRYFFSLMLISEKEQLLRELKCQTYDNRSLDEISNTNVQITQLQHDLSRATNEEKHQISKR